MTPRQFYEDTFGEISTQGTMTYGQRTSVTVFAKVSKGALSEEDRILVTVVDSAKAGGVMSDDIYEGLMLSFVFYHPSVTWNTTLGDRLRTINQLQGTDTPQEVFDDLKKDIVPIGEARDLVYKHVVSALMRTNNTDPDLIYLVELCKHLPRLKGNTSVNPF